MSWLMASTLPKRQAGKPVDRTTLSLAEARSKFDSTGKDMHFGLVFAPPEIAAVCDDEAVLYLNISEITLYNGQRRD